MMNDNKTEIGLVILRWCIAVGILLVTFGIGYYAGVQLSTVTDQIPLLRKGVPALGLGLMLALFGKAIENIYEILVYTKTGSLLDLWKPGVTAFSMALTIAFAIHLVVVTVDEAKPEATIVVWEGMRLPPSAAGPLAVLPVFFLDEASGYNSTTNTFATGTELAPSEIELIRRLARGLEKCTSGGKEVVKLAVKGFASSSGYQGKTAAEAEELNLQLANIRAEKVIQIIRNEVGTDSAIIIDQATWSTTAEMDAIKTIDDKLKGQYSSDLGLLNRRADIILEKAGNCQITSEQQAP